MLRNIIDIDYEAMMVSLRSDRGAMVLFDFIGSDDERRAEMLADPHLFAACTDFSQSGALALGGDEPAPPSSDESVSEDEASGQQAPYDDAEVEALEESEETAELEAELVAPALRIGVTSSRQCYSCGTG